ncbi:MAG: hypothetical protein H6600_06650 [Flavobacteriales bacterium]|nr:hypothetical protein [Flavobacteriales bacterium]
MNKGIVRILIGTFFLCAGIYGFLVKTDYLRIVAILIILYGLWSIGWGLYLRKKENQSTDMF